MQTVNQMNACFGMFAKPITLSLSFYGSGKEIDLAYLLHAATTVEHLLLTFTEVVHTVVMTSVSLVAARYGMEAFKVAMIK